MHFGRIGIEFSGTRDLDKSVVKASLVDQDAAQVEKTLNVLRVELIARMNSAFAVFGRTRVFEFACPAGHDERVPQAVTWDSSWGSLESAIA